MVKGSTQQQDSELFISSPVVGTFYSSPAPGDPPFVNIGDHVNEDTIVAIIDSTIAQSKLYP